MHAWHTAQAQALANRETIFLKGEEEIGEDFRMKERMGNGRSMAG